MSCQYFNIVNKKSLLLNGPKKWEAYRGTSVSSDGDLTFNHGGLNCAWGTCSDYWIVKLNPEPLGIKFNETINEFNAFYNYSSSSLDVSFYSKLIANIHLELVDVLGKVYFSKSISILPGNNRIPLRAGVVDPGIYFVRLLSDEENISKKVVVN